MSRPTQGNAVATAPSNWGPTTSGVPVSLIQDEHLDTAQVEGRTVVEVIDEPAWGGDEDVRRCPESGLLRLHIQASCKEERPPQVANSVSGSSVLTGPYHLPHLIPDAGETAEDRTGESPARVDFTRHWERQVISLQLC